MAGVDESFGEKFSALLQPIRCAAPPSFLPQRFFADETYVVLWDGRDLAQNWNIDVASELEDYMDELEDIKISFDGGETELNFAEGTGAPRRLPS